LLALKILGVIFIIITLIMLIPVGADISYIAGELNVSAKISSFKLVLYPPQKKKKQKNGKDKTKKERKPKATTNPTGNAETASEKKFKLNFDFDEIMSLLKTVLRGFGKFGRKLKVERFLLHYTASGKDPYTTANTFGYVNAALNMLAPVCSNRFTVKDLDVWTDVDFMSEKTGFDFAIIVTIRIGQIFAAVFTIIFGALAIFIKNKLRLKHERNNTNTVDNNTIDPAERKETNG